MITTPGATWRSGFERDQRVVDDEDRARSPMRRMIPATTTESSGRSTPAMPRQMTAGWMALEPSASVHDLWRTFSTSQLADRLQVGAAAARLCEDEPVFVGELADRLRAARVDAEDVGHRCNETCVTPRHTGQRPTEPAGRSRA